MAPNKMYEHIPRERFVIIRKRYDEFLEYLADPTSDVVKVFDTLGPRQQQELALIREVSRELQQKKEDDVKKAAQAAEEEAAEAEKAKLEKKTETEEVKENGSATDAVEVDDKVEK